VHRSASPPHPQPFSPAGAKGARIEGEQTAATKGARVGKTANSVSRAIGTRIGRARLRSESFVANRYQTRSAFPNLCRRLPSRHRTAYAVPLRRQGSWRRAATKTGTAGAGTTVEKVRVVRAGRPRSLLLRSGRDPRGPGCRQSRTVGREAFGTAWFRVPTKRREFVALHMRARRTLPFLIESCHLKRYNQSL
jgi:hypothetical protein